MSDIDSDTCAKTAAALSAAAAALRREERFTDAFYLLRLQVERGLAESGTLGDLVDSASAAGRLGECAEFLAEQGKARSPDAALLNYAAGIYGALGKKDESRRYARLFASRRPFSPSSVKQARLRLLVLQCAATGDYRYSPRSRRFFMPGISDLYTLLDPQVASHRLLVDDLPAALAALDSLPPCDVVFNAISDPDYGEALRNAAALTAMAGLPVFNAPQQVRLLNRESLPGLLQGLEGVVAAKSVFLPPKASTSADIAAAMSLNGLEFPVIVRAPGFQGGRQMALLRNPDELPDDLYRGNGLYVIEFMDVAVQDDRAPATPLYPKYRAFYVEGKLYPVHLFFADQYEVHKKTSDPVQAKYPWLPEREVEFLADPEGYFPQGRWEELRLAMDSFGLDYFGVDFAPSARPADQGRFVLFECNPSMRNWLTLLPEGDRVQRKWREITLAASDALCRKGRVEPWPFRLRRGKIG